MSDDRGRLERDVARLAAERTALFTRSGRTTGLSNAEQGRLHAIERELDECFNALRRVRAARDMARFAREEPISRGALRRRNDTALDPRSGPRA